MSISEAQYYQAKVFLDTLAQAHLALEQAAKQKAQIERIKSFQRNLVSGIKAEQIKLTDVGVYRNRDFDRTRIKQISNFTNEFFAKRLQGFSDVSTSQGLQKMLKKALE